MILGVLPEGSEEQAALKAEDRRMLTPTPPCFFMNTLYEGVDQRIIVPFFFLRRFGIYLLPYDSYLRAEAAGSISSYQTLKSLTVCVVSKVL